MGVRTVGAVVGGTAIVLLLAAASAEGGRADAAAASDASGTVAVSTAAWRAAPAPTGSTHVGTTLVLEWSTVGGQGVATFDVINVGDLPLATQALDVRVVVAGGGSAPDPVTLDACAGGVWAADGSDCPGTVVALGTAAASPLDTGVALEPGGRVSVRAMTPRRAAARADVEVDVLVTRAAVRAPTVTTG